MMNPSAIKTTGVVILFALLGFCIYANTLEAQFQFDDKPRLLENRHIRVTEFSPVTFVKAGLKSSTTRPVAFTSFAVNYYYGRYNPFGYHFVNICIHILTGVFLFLFIQSTLQTPSLKAKERFPFAVAFLSALIWLVHPLHTQSVTYIVQRMNSMSAMFYILSFWLYVHGRLAGKKAPRWPWFAGSIAAWLLSLGSKEIAVTLPVFVWLYEWFFFQDLRPEWFRRYAKYFLGVVVILGILTTVFLGFEPLKKLTTLKAFSRGEFTYLERVLTQPRVVLFYIGLFFFPRPANLNLDHDFLLSRALLDPPTTLLSLLVIAGFIGLAVFLAKKERLISFAVLWFFGNLALESSVIPLDIIFEHRTYLPSMLVALVGVGLAFRFIKSKPAIIVTVCLTTAVSAYWTYERNRVWHDEYSLWKDCNAKSPRKVRPHNNLGLALERLGQTDEAVDHFLTALRLNPENPKTYNNLGDVLARMGKIDEALRRYRQALSLDPGYAAAHNSLGIALAKANRLEAAISHYREALRIRPEWPIAHNNLAMALEQQGRLNQAVSHYKQAIALLPDAAEIYLNLGNVQVRQGRLDEAVSSYEKALSIRPDYPKAHNNLGIALIHRGNLKTAIIHFKLALNLNADDAEARQNLKNALILLRQSGG